MPPIVLAALALLASLSPILTLSHLWQVKEWRWDRLREHLHREGWIVQLTGKLRLTILIALLPTLLVDFSAFPHLWAMLWTTVILSVLSAATIVQLAMRKQLRPVATRKAMMVVTLSLLIALGLALKLTTADHYISILILGLVPYFSPLIIAIAWLLLWPIDRFMKRRIMDRAKKLRAGSRGKNPAPVVIGITGSVGKTTTKELIAHILKPLNPVVTPAHVNTEMGVAQWLIGKLQAASDKRQAISAVRDSESASELTAYRSPLTAPLIVEMGAYRKGEIALLCSIAQPTIGVVTAIGEQHIGLFGSPQAILDAKGELFESLPADGHAFINLDDPSADALRKKCRCAVTTVGTAHHPNLLAQDIEETGSGIRFKIENVQFDVPLAGTHNVSNILLALAVGLQLKRRLPEMAAALKTFAPLSRTFAVRTEHGVTILDDTYNSSPQSFKAAIAWAKNQPHERKMLLVSGIIELGEAEENIHLSLAGTAADIFDQAYVTDPLFLDYFRRGGFGDEAHSTEGTIERLKSSDLLVCVGRMSPKIIQKFLP